MTRVDGAPAQRVQASRAWMRVCCTRRFGILAFMMRDH
jgi:hypothetical protein